MKRVSIMIGFCAIIMATGCGEGKQTHIETTHIIEEKVEGIEVYGEVVVEESNEIVIDFPAVIEKVYIKDGQKVKKGDPLISLDFKDYELLIEMKENEVKIYETQLKQLKETINPIGLEVERIKQELAVKRNYMETNTDPDMEILKRNLEIASKEVEQINTEYEKNKELLHIGAISEKELKDYQQAIILKDKEKKDIITKIDQTKTNKELEITALTSQLKSNTGQLTNTDKKQAASIEEINIRINILKLELNQMKNKINRPYIKDNTIIAEEDNLLVYDIPNVGGTKVGELSGPILKVMKLNTMIITMDIPEEYINEVEVGDKVEIELYTDQDQEIKGKIIRISDLAVEKNGETIIEADVSIETGLDKLRPGLSVDAIIYK